MTTVSPAARRARRTLWLIAASVIAPVALAYALYFLFPRGALTNYGELLSTGPIAPLAGARIDGGRFRLDDLKGRWVIVVPTDPGCEGDCARQALYAARQVRTMQGREMDRVERVLMVTSDWNYPSAALADHPGLIVARAGRAAIAALPRGADAIYLVDPLGNQVLAWPRNPDIKAMSRDLNRVLKASRIG